LTKENPQIAGGDREGKAFEVGENTFPLLAFIRIMIAVFVPAFAIGGLTLLIPVTGTLTILKENNLVEWLEVVVLLATALVFFASAKVNDRHKHLRIVLGLVMLAFVARELDSFIENVVCNRRKRAYYVPFGGLLVGAAVYVWLRRRLVWEAVKQYLRTGSFLILAFGCAVTLCVAQFLGQRHLWRMMLKNNSSPENYKRAASVAKNFVEENLEILGYLYFLFAAVEDVFTRLRPRRAEKSPKELP